MSLTIAHLTIMEETPVVIVGAGPAGLALALSLAQFEVHVGHSILEHILEEDY